MPIILKSSSWLILILSLISLILINAIIKIVANYSYILLINSTLKAFNNYLFSFTLLAYAKAREATLKAKILNLVKKYYKY